MKRRKEVELFADAMERKLRKNDHKGGWEDDGSYDLYDRLLEELKEFETAHRNDSNRLLNEGADVANFIMMICDVSGRLDKQSQKEQ